MGELDPAAEQPEKVGPYRLEQKLGTGGMGAVWRARDERLKRPVALKRILPASTSDPMVRERFRREAEAVARLNHPGIVHVYDIVETETSDWIVMELVEGRTLQELLQDGPLDSQRVLRLGSEIAHGLAEAHAKGFIHRDLKTANVMVTPTGRAKVLDFGVAKQILPEAQETTLSSPGTVVGTSYAMSPEQAMGLPIDARSDLFSLGSLLYEMVTGVAPFRADTAQATLARVCSFRQRPASSLRPDVPSELSDLIDRLLEKEPANRPGDAMDVATLLDKVAWESGPQSAMRGRSPLREVETTLQEGRPFVASGELATERFPEFPEASTRARHVALWSSLVLLLAIVASVLIARHAAPKDPYVLYQEGQAALRRYDKKGNLDRAIGSFQEILAEDDQHAPAYAALAKAYWIKNQGESKDPLWLDQGLAMAQRAVALDKNLSMAWISLGLIEFSKGNAENAARDFKQALRIDPLNADAWYGLGRAYEAQKKIQDAEAAHQKAIEIRPDRMYYDELGSLYYRTGRTRDAIRAYQKSIELAPDSFYGYRNIGAAYFAQGDFAEAAAQFQKGLQVQPDSSLYGNLGTLYFYQGFYPQAAEAFEKALEMPGGANSHLQWGNLGDACRRTPGKEKRAREAYLSGIQLLHEEIALKPNDVTLRSYLALYRARRGDREEALAELTKLAKTAGRDANAWFRMAIAYETMGAREAALAALERALREGLPLKKIKDEPELLRLRADRRYHEEIAAFDAS